jgi:hypothetical protein
VGGQMGHECEDDHNEDERGVGGAPAS